MSRILMFLFAGLVLGFFAAGCGTTPPACSAATCGGCCNTSGKCEAGSSPSACGINGATCGRCGTGTVCQLGECSVANTGGGTGGGSTGGGTTGGGTGGGTTGGGTGGGGTGGGTGGGCRTVSTITTQQANLRDAEYRTFSANNGFYNVAIFGLPPLSSGFDAFRVEVVYPGGVGPMPPVTHRFVAQGYFACPICATYNETCDTMGECQKQYLAQSGSVTISRADRDASAGRIAGSGTNVRFVEWDFMTDTAVPGGGCVIATTIGPWDVGWNADGGMPPP